MSGDNVLAATRTSVVLNAGRAFNARNPHTWLELRGDASGTPGTRVMYGCLRPSSGKHQNSAAAFAMAKISVGAPPGTLPWTQTAAKVEVLLPPGACDRFLDPRTLMETVDATRPAKIDALLAYLTFTFPCERLHEQWELVRTFIRKGIVDPFEVAALLVAHAPHLAGSANLPHVHALIVPRRLSPLGFIELLPVLADNEAHSLIRNAFLEIQSSWPHRR